MARPKTASEADPQELQEQGSEAQVQDPASEDAAAREQEQMQRVREALLQDETFLISVLDSPAVKTRLQSQQDRALHEATLPLKQQLEQASQVIEQLSQTNDPVMLEYQRLKDDGLFEEALQLLENKQISANAAAVARQEGEKQASERILQAVAARPEFADLSQDDWKTVYAEAATEATGKGRNYITVDEYVASATRATVKKEREKIMSEQDTDLDKKVDERVEAAMKAAGIEKRAAGGGPENIQGRGTGGAIPTDEEATNMSQEEWNALSDEARTAILRRAAQTATS